MVRTMRAMRVIIVMNHVYKPVGFSVNFEHDSAVEKTTTHKAHKIKPTTATSRRRSILLAGLANTNSTTHSKVNRKNREATDR